jgi:hypothetical protein
MPSCGESEGLYISYLPEALKLGVSMALNSEPCDLVCEVDVVGVADLRRVGDDHAVALFQSGQDFDAVYGCATQLYVDPCRIGSVVV